MEVRLALPTLGWVAADDDSASCSFPLPDGSCGDAEGANCSEPGEISDPTLTSIRSDESSITDWVKYLKEDQDFDIRFLAMDNEPELWGYTHYDVHPACTTYSEILEKFLSYARAVRGAAPNAEITGPVTCCWFFYWDSAAGKKDRETNGNMEFLPWFLESVRNHDETHGMRTLDVLDIHYYPEGVYNNNVDQPTAEHRLRSTLSLWDNNYVDESWIGVPVSLISRMKGLINEHYPGTKLGISEWNWGADDTMNGALAIADVLGIFGREDLYLAAYWRYPEVNSPGYYSFKLYTNFDDQGSRFGDTSVWAQSENRNEISSYAALDSQTGNLHLMILNKDPDQAIPVQVQLNGITPNKQGTLFRYQGSSLEDIETNPIEIGDESFTIELPPYSISLFVIEEREDLSMAEN
jgi:hypothetical protein